MILYFVTSLGFTVLLLMSGLCLYRFRIDWIEHREKQLNHINLLINNVEAHVQLNKKILNRVESISTDFKLHSSQQQEKITCIEKTIKKEGRGEKE